MAGHQINEATLRGNLGRDPEVRSTRSGDKVASLSVATTFRRKDRNTGDWLEETEWHRVVLWGKVAEIAEKYAQKGSDVFIRGRLKTEKWTDQGGIDRYTTKIYVGLPGDVFSVLAGGLSQPENEGRSGHYDKRKKEPPAEKQGTPEDHAADPDLDDEIPF